MNVKKNALKHSGRFFCLISSVECLIAIAHTFIPAIAPVLHAN